MPTVAVPEHNLLDRFRALAERTNAGLMDSHVARAERLQRINDLKHEVAALEAEHSAMRETLHQVAARAAERGNFDELDKAQQRAARLPLLLKGAKVAVLRAQIENEQQHKEATARLSQQGRLAMIALVDELAQVQKQRHTTGAAVEAARNEHHHAAQQERAFQTALDQLLNGT